MMKSDSIFFDQDNLYRPLLISKERVNPAISTTTHDHVLQRQRLLHVTSDLFPTWRLPSMSPLSLPREDEEESQL